MADFQPPFADDNLTRRFPTVDEKNDGFPCGDLDKDLFNGLFWCLQAEILEVILAANIVPSNLSHTQLRDAIIALIPPNTDTNTFLSSINGNTAGGVVLPNNLNQFVLLLNNNKSWTLSPANTEFELQTKVLIGKRVLPFNPGAASDTTTNYPINISSAPASATHMVLFISAILRIASTSAAANASITVSVNGNTAPYRTVYLLDPSTITPQDDDNGFYVDIPLNEAASHQVNVRISHPTGHAGAIEGSAYLMGYKTKATI